MRISRVISLYMAVMGCAGHRKLDRSPILVPVHSMSRPSQEGRAPKEKRRRFPGAAPLIVEPSDRAGLLHDDLDAAVARLLHAVGGRHRGFGFAAAADRDLVGGDAAIYQVLA